MRLNYEIVCLLLRRFSSSYPVVLLDASHGRSHIIDLTTRGTYLCYE